MYFLYGCSRVQQRRKISHPSLLQCNRFPSLSHISTTKPIDSSCNNSSSSNSSTFSNNNSSNSNPSQVPPSPLLPQLPWLASYVESTFLIPLYFFLPHLHLLLVCGFHLRKSRFQARFAHLHLSHTTPTLTRVFVFALILNRPKNRPNPPPHPHHLKTMIANGRWKGQVLLCGGLRGICWFAGVGWK